MVDLLYQVCFVFSIEFRKFPFILIYFSNAKTIALSSSSEYSIPDASNSFGYMLIFVKPGIVFISFIIILFVPFSTKKSTLESPLPSTALNAFIACFLISSEISFGKFAGICVLDAWLLYFESKL